MTDPDLQRIVRRVARRHIEEAHPERLEELGVVFDSAYATAVERASAGGDRGGRTDGAGLPIEASLLDLSLVGFTVVSAFQLAQNALLSRRIDRLAEVVERAKGLTKPQRRELEEIAVLVAREVTVWRPAEPAAPVGVAALQLVVLRRDRNGQPGLEFRLGGRMGDRSYPFRSFGEQVLGKEPERYFEELFDQLVRREAKNDEERQSHDRWVRSRGADLFKAFLPAALQAELRILARTGGDLLVISEEPWIPWELLKFPAAEDDGETRFLAEAFALARWHTGSKLAPPERLPLRRLAVVRSRLADLDRAEEEAAFLLGQADRARRRVEPVAARYLELTGAMARGHHDGWHFIGHGDRSKAGAEWWTIALDDRTMTPQDLGDEVSLGLAKQRPFVFLNACRVAGSAPGLVGLGGWPAGFLEAGAGAFLGPLWAVPSDQAAVFARLFYERLLGGEPIGEAVRGARLKLRELFPGDPTWLAYALYADPAAVCPAPEGEGLAEPPEIDEYSGKAWSDKREYKKLAKRLSETTGDGYEALVVRMLRAALGVWDDELVSLGEGLWALGAEPPYPVVVQILRFEPPGEALGAEEVARTSDTLARLRRASIEAAQLVLVHNRHGGSEPYRHEVGAALRELERTGVVPGATLWNYQQLLRRAFGGMLHLLVSESRRRSLSLETVDEVLGRASWRDEPLDRVPLRTSVLVADQHRLVREEGEKDTVADPAVLAVAGEERSVTLLLGEFGYGKTTALARALLGHESEVFFVPAAGMSSEVHGAKDLLSRCVDLERLLEGIPEEERDDYRLLARPVIEYVFKQKEIDAVLVLDGLDESPFLARAGGLQNLVNNLWDLRVPVVLSMRTEFWDDKLQDFEASVGDRAGHGEPRLRRIRKIELLEWRAEEMQAFLERFAASVEEQSGRERLRELAGSIEDGRFEEIYGDVPRRPLFLRMIAETVAATGLPGRQVGRARLMAEAARLKVRRDVTAPIRAGGVGRASILGRPMTLADTLELAWRAMVVAAAHMTRTADLSIELLLDCPFEDVRATVPRLQELDDPLPLFLHSLLRLSEPRTGYRPARVRFAHRAFQEFFLAWHLVTSGGASSLKVPESVASWMDDLLREGLAGPG
jgi:hypothetical protein